MDLEMDVMAEAGAGRRKGDVFHRVASGAVLPDGEGGRTVVAGAAELALLHGGHGDTPGRDSGANDSIVTVPAGIERRMDAVAESGYAGLFYGDGHLHGLPVARAALPADREGGCAVMAGAAGIPLFHLGHGPPAVAGAGLEQIVVTVAAGVGLQMFHMGKIRIGRHVHVAQGVASAAAVRGRCREGAFTVVTGAARQALAHIGHGGAHTGRTGGENAVVAVAAAINLPVCVVTEDHIPRHGRPEADITGLRVTAVTVAGHTENGLILVADTAGTPLLHILHGVTPAGGPADEDAAVAAVAVEELRVELVAEHGVVGGEGHLPHIGVALVAIPLDREGGIAVVAPPA